LKTHGIGPEGGEARPMFLEKEDRLFKKDILLGAFPSKEGGTEGGDLFVAAKEGEHGG